jgi:squalene-hopene/tetraprenyl-beta-curcumene cyclase
MARALDAAKIDRVGEHEWKKELSARIVSLQREDGGWANENNRFWEADPVLCTSFALLALELCR